MTNFNSSSSSNRVIGFLISPFTFFPPSLSFFDCVKRTQSLLLRIFLIFFYIFFVMVSWSSQLTQLLFSLIAECRKKEYKKITFLNMNKTPVLSFVFFCFILAHRWGKDGNFLMDFLSNTISQKKTSCAARKRPLDQRPWTHEKHERRNEWWQFPFTEKCI